MNREKLIAAGIDYDDGLKRMSGNEALYEKFLIKFLQDDNIHILGKSGQVDTDTVFRAVHTLKGVSATLGIKELAEACDVICKKIRAGETDYELNEVYRRYGNVAQAVEAEVK